MRTQWELSGNATYTSDVNEYAYDAALDGLLCLASNDAGEALITIPVSLTIRSLRDDIAAVRAAAASHSPLAQRGGQMVNAEHKLESYRKAWAVVREAWHQPASRTPS